MKLLYRLFTGYSRMMDRFHARGLHLGPTYGDPEAIEIRTAVQAGRWQVLADALAKSPRDWARRSFLVSAATDDWRNPPPAIAAWLREQPQSIDALLTAGAMWTQYAWQARGSGYSDTVSNEGARLFFERLQRAHLMLTQVTQRNPEDVVAWTWLLVVGRGMGAGLEEAESYFVKAATIDPHNYEAHHQMMQYKCAKWFGSNEQMWAFAESAVSNAPAGSPVYSLIPVAHREHLVTLFDSPQATDPEQIERDYWRRPVVAKSITDAYGKFRVKPAGSDPDRLAAFGDFAYGLWKCGAKQQAAEAFRQIGDRVVGGPWHMIFMPAKTFRQARRECGV